MENIFNTAHIHLEQVTFRVHVKDADVFDIDLMNDEDMKPDFVNYISRSNDPQQKKDTLLVNCVDGYDLEVIATWINKFL